MAARSGRDRRSVRKWRRMRPKVVVLLRVVETERYRGGPTVMKLGSGSGREATGRQMAPRKLKIRGKMAAFSPRIQKSNGFSDGLTGGQNRQRVRLPAAAAARRVAGPGTTTKAVSHCFHCIQWTLVRSAELERSEPLGLGRRRDGPEAGMRSQTGGRTRSLSSGRVLMPVAIGPLCKQTFVMVSAATVTLTDRRSMRGRRGGNGADGGASSGLRLLSGQGATDLLTQESIHTRLQDQTGIDKMEREAAATGEGEAVGEDDQGVEVEGINLLQSLPRNGHRGLK